MTVLHGMDIMEWTSWIGHEEVEMAATQIDIDDDALEAAMRLAGTRTKRDTVNLALQEYVQRRRRSEARLRHSAAAQSWDDSEFWSEHAAEKSAE